MQFYENRRVGVFGSSLQILKLNNIISKNTSLLLKLKNKIPYIINGEVSFLRSESP